MKLKWALLVIGLAAGISLTGLGTLIVSENFRAELMVNIEDKSEYSLLQPDKDVIRAGVIMTASGTVAASVSLSSMIMFWKRNSQRGAASAPEET